ncbi:MAG: PAC2 family protein [Thaumarchaeota archaeon]|nr:PAC2 family protein [Nitrososphaerota archaeon]
MWNRWEVLEEPELRDPAVIVAVSTSDPRYVLLYSHARELADYLVKHLGFKHFVNLYCSAMPAAVRVNADGTTELPKSQGYYCRGGRDIVLYTSDASPVSFAYEFSETLLGHAKGLGSKEVYSVGARFLEPPISPFVEPDVLGFGTDSGTVGRLKEFGVKILENEPSYYFSSIVVAMARNYGMGGYRVSVNHGEPKPHPRAVKAMTLVLSKMLGFEIDVSGLDASAKELEEALRKGVETGRDFLRPEGGSSMYR